MNIVNIYDKRELLLWLYYRVRELLERGSNSNIGNINIVAGEGIEIDFDGNHTYTISTTGGTNNTVVVPKIKSLQIKSFK